MKLQHYGIGGKISNWIASLLRGRRQRLIVNGTGSAWSPVLSGVPRGTVISPILSLIYINDITCDINSRMRLFADDSIIYREIHSIDNHHKLQDDITKLQSWSERWQMTFKPEKCNVLSITSKRHISKFGYHIKDVALESKDSWKCLGVIIDSKLNWNDHCIEIATKHVKHSDWSGAPYIQLLRNASQLLIKPSTERVWNTHLLHGTPTPPRTPGPSKASKTTQHDLYITNTTETPVLRPSSKTSTGLHFYNTAKSMTSHHVVQDTLRHCKYKFPVCRPPPSAKFPRPTLPWAVLHPGSTQSGLLRTHILCPNHSSLELPPCITIQRYFAELLPVSGSDPLWVAPAITPPYRCTSIAPCFFLTLLSLSPSSPFFILTLYYPFF